MKYNEFMDPTEIIPAYEIIPNGEMRYRMDNSMLHPGFIVNIMNPIAFELTVELLD
jgi:hypothetical protein